MKKNWLTKIMGLTLAFALMMVAMLAPAAAAAAIPADGAYTGSANGMGGAVNVTVTVKDGKIAEVAVG